MIPGFLFIYFYILQYFILFDVLEVFVGADFEFVGGLFVADDDTMLMHLEG